jgi:hypothetical protein
MKMFIALLAFAAVLLAQPKLSLSANPVRSGAPASMNISLSGNSVDAAGVVAVDFSLAFPAGLNITISSAVADKNLNCAGVTVRCILIGDSPSNATVIANGVIATVTFTAPSVATFTISPTFLHGVNAAGDAITVAADVPLTVPFLSPCDINGDGITNVDDLLAWKALYRAEANGGSCGIGDLNGDGTCGAIDEQRIINVLRGQACRTGK